METSSKGTLWRILNSWWILLTFTLVLNWFAFFYIALTSKNKRWALWGIVYLLPMVGIVTDSYSLNNWLNGVIIVSFIIGNIASIIHAFMVRKEYLLRLEALFIAYDLKKNMAGEIMKNQIEAEFGVDLDSYTQPMVSDASAPLSNSAPIAQPVRETPIAPKVMASTEGAIDLNRVSEDEIAALPGIGIILAKKAISIRSSTGGFSSIEEFAQALELKPHIVERIRPLITFKPIAPLPPQRGGRVVDY